MRKPSRHRCASAVITYGSELSVALRRMSTMTCAAARPEPDPHSRCLLMGAKRTCLVYPVLIALTPNWAFTTTQLRKRDLQQA
jgi:hypothetical protein